MKRNSILPKTLAVFLSLILSLPNSAYALRQSGLEENRAKGSFLKEIGYSVPAAGTEESRDVAVPSFLETASDSRKRVFLSWRKLIKRVDHRDRPVWDSEGYILGLPRITEMAGGLSVGVERVRQQLFGIRQKGHFAYRFLSSDGTSYRIPNFLPVHITPDPGAVEMLSSWISEYNKRHKQKPILYTGKELHLAYQAAVLALQSEAG